MFDVIPGILEKNFSEIERKLAIIKPFSRIVHIDFLDGKFAPETSFLDPQAFKKYKDDFFMEAHLMVEDPTLYVKALAAAGFKRFMGHVEKMNDLDEFIAQGEIFGEVGVALDIGTQIDSLTVSFDDLDCILLMGVKAGKSGQEFLSDTLEKIKKIREKTQIPIEIDGGINDRVISEAIRVGANRFVTTSYIFANPDPLFAYEKLLSLA